WGARTQRAQYGGAFQGRGPGGPGGGGPRGGGGGGGGGFGGILPIGGPLGMAGQVAVKAARDAAIGAAGYTVDALYEAGHFQTTMAAIGNVSGAKGKQFDSIRSLIFAQGAKYAMSPDEAGRQYLDTVRQTPTL